MANIKRTFTVTFVGRLEDLPDQPDLSNVLVTSWLYTNYDHHEVTFEKDEVLNG